MILLRSLILELAKTTNKIKIGDSVLYGVVHGEYVQIKDTDRAILESELKKVNGVTFYEGPKGHEPIVQKLLDTFGIDISSESWEPNDNELTGNARIGKLVAGWWNQTLEDKVGLINLKDEWNRTNLPLTAKIGDVFKQSVGEKEFNFIINNFTDYSDKGRYSTKDFTDALNQVGFDEKGNPTEALETFNLAGHDQVFPEDNGLPTGKLKSIEVAFNLFRDKYLINKMKQIPGIYFVGEGHISNIKKLLNF
jgi:hypothetical protein